MTAAVVDLFGDSAAAGAEEIPGDSLRNDFVGRAGEHLVCAVLAEMGVTAHHVSSVGYDVVADGSEGLVRVQVKTTVPSGSSYKFLVLKDSGRHAGRRTKRPLDRRECDVVALVALDKRRALFLPVERCQGMGMTVSAKEFASDGIERKSWLECS